MTWLLADGRVVEAPPAALPADDRAVLHGRGVFETFRARAGRVYRLDAHVRRMTAGAHLLGIAALPALGSLGEAVREVTDRSGLSDARVRVTLTAGPEGDRPSVVIDARPATDYPEELYERGMAAVVAALRRNETSPLSRIKSLNCLDNVLAREEARAVGADTALLLNTRGLVAEAATANVFAVRRGVLVTPPVEDGPLPGVTREAVLALAVDAGLRVEEASLALKDLLGADEAFLTGAVMGVMPLVSVDSRAIGRGKPGEIARRLREAYERVAREGDKTRNT